MRASAPAGFRSAPNRTYAACRMAGDESWIDAAARCALRAHPSAHGCHAVAWLDGRSGRTDGQRVAPKCQAAPFHRILLTPRSPARGEEARKGARSDSASHTALL